MTEPLTYTVEQAARMLGVSRGVGYEAARRGELPTIRLGRRLLVPMVALERMLGLENGDGPVLTRINAALTNEERPANQPDALQISVRQGRHGSG